VGGAGGVLHVTFCPAGGQNPRRDALRLSAAPAPSPGRTTVASLNEPQFPSFGAETGSVTSLALKIGRSQEF
jgi:hypothetical protein